MSQFKEFASQSAYQAALNRGELMPPYVAFYPSPTIPGKTEIVYGNVDGTSASEVVATAQLLARFEEYQRQVREDIAAFEEPLTEVQKAISPYSKSIPLPLTHNLATGQILAMEGDMVVLKAQEGWGITRIDREEFGALGLASGDTLLLPMAHFDEEGKPTDNLMLVGAVLFAAEEAVKGQSGEVLYTRRTSLFRATDSDIPLWGGVKKWLAIADNESLLICHPLDITEATITRNGNDAANAAADLNQRRRIEEKLNLGGKDPRAWVGMADQLAPSEKTEQAAYRDEVLPSGRILGFAPELGPSGAGTRDGQIADAVSPVMREVSGVCGGSGQMMPPIEIRNWSFPGVFYKFTDGVLEIHPKEGASLYNTDARYTFDKTIIVGHKYMAMMDANVINGDSVFALNLYSGLSGIREFAAVPGWKTGGLISQATGTTALYRFQVVGNGYKSEENTAQMKNPLLLDLTLLPQLPATFVASLGQSDAHRVAHALGFLALQRD